MRTHVEYIRDILGGKNIQEPHLTPMCKFTQACDGRKNPTLCCMVVLMTPRVVHSAHRCIGRTQHRRRYPGRVAKGRGKGKRQLRKNKHRGNETYAKTPSTPPASFANAQQKQLESLEHAILAANSRTRQTSQHVLPLFDAK